MYRPFKALISRPINHPLMDKFQNDVAAALKGFVLTIFDAANEGLVPPPGKQTGVVLTESGWKVPASGPPAPHTHIIADIVGLVAALAGKVGIGRLVNTTSPITGGGDLSSDRTLSFDQSVALNNNARVSIRKNTGAVVGVRRQLNFVEGAGITINTADDAANEEVDVVITASGGGGSVVSGAVTITVPFPAYEYNTTIVDAAITGLSRVIIVDGDYKDTDENIPGFVIPYITDQVVGSVNIRMYTIQNYIFTGPFKFKYMVI